MLRSVLMTLLPLLLPLIVYSAWRLVYGNERLPDWAQQVPWVPLLSIGIVLAALTLGAWRLTSNVPAGSEYEPPHMENGKLVPGTFR
ncbi:MAG: hypothetical protein KDC18_06720 [Alphaproteobacteria bacterium]|nr:hypothetical protein [Alphaproteobacteria bacterium]MCB9929187.1 hypothetical protein [Alphaproteobacteria bacterium]